MNLLPNKIGKNDKFDRTARFTFPGSELESLKHINTLVQENLLKDSKNFKSSLLTKTHTIPFPSSSVRQKFSRLGPEALLSSPFVTISRKQALL